MQIKYLLFAAPLFLFSCSREDKCDKITEMPITTAHKVDMKWLSKDPRVNGLLEYYKDRLQAYYYTEYITNDQTNAYISCNIYYKGLQIFFDSYNIELKGNYMTTSGPLPPDTINLNLTPTIMINKAIKLARPKLERDCNGFQLGIRNKNINNDSMPDYRLVWLIGDGKNGFTDVFVDAHTGEEL